MEEEADEAAAGEPEPSTRFAELKDKVERATRLIGELREANYALSAELVLLQRKMSHLEADRRAAAGIGESASKQSLSEELQLLRDERKIIRAKVQSLLERIEKI